MSIQILQEAKAALNEPSRKELADQLKAWKKAAEKMFKGIEMEGYETASGPTRSDLEWQVDGAPPGWAARQVGDDDFEIELDEFNVFVMEDPDMVKAWKLTDYIKTHSGGRYLDVDFGQYNWFDRLAKALLLDLDKNVNRWLPSNVSADINVRNQSP
jgi:hypothetical protein